MSTEELLQNYRLWGSSTWWMFLKVSVYRSMMNDDDRPFYRSIISWCYMHAIASIVWECDRRWRGDDSSRHIQSQRLARNLALRISFQSITEKLAEAANHSYICQLPVTEWRAHQIIQHHNEAKHLIPRISSNGGINNNSSGGGTRQWKLLRNILGRRC